MSGARPVSTGPASTESGSTGSTSTELSGVGLAGAGLAAQIVGLLTRRRQTVAVAESLTGGLLGAAITTVPGASAVFRGGVIAYATDVKAALLGVSAALLAERGAVDPDVAGAMAAGVRERLGAAIGAATTGVAGPDAADGKPPGTVHIAVSTAGGTVVQTLALSGGRDVIRRDTVERSLRLMWSVLWEENP
ncbi:MAG TPA: nicotinamide-nucleotide amidohydrolase family protein [Streptosporangiaceae bacterium]